MGKVRILLCCGVGMSSGFLAQRARQAAKKKKMDVSVEARSHVDVASYLNQIDVLFIGPHYANELADFQTMAAPYPVKVAVIPKDIYSEINGEGILDLAEKLMNE